MSFTRTLPSLLVLGTLVSLPAPGVTASFIPDGRVTGSSLVGWHRLGTVEWKVAGGELSVGPKGGGGWLVLDRAYQDVGIFSSVKCTSACKAGILLRAEKTPEGGLRGIYVSLTRGDLASYVVTLYATGR